MKNQIQDSVKTTSSSVDHSAYQTISPVPSGLVETPVSAPPSSAKAGVIKTRVPVVIRIARAHPTGTSTGSVESTVLRRENPVTAPVLLNASSATASASLTVPQTGGCVERSANRSFDLITCLFLGVPVYFLGL